MSTWSAHGYYSNRLRGARRLAEQADDTASLVINDTSVDKKAVVEGLSSKLLKEKGELARPTRFELVTPAFGGRHFICK